LEAIENKFYLEKKILPPYVAVVPFIHSVFNLKSLVFENDTFSVKNGICNRKELDFGAKILACENSRFSSLFTAGDVSHGGTSATQRQKFHTDDVN